MNRRQLALRFIPWGLLLLAFIASSCSRPNMSDGILLIDALEPHQLAVGESLKVAVTTTIAGDILKQVGGEFIQLQILLKPGGDPHGYQALPADLQAVSEANIIFVSGFSLEGTMLESLRSAAPDIPMVELSQGIEPLLRMAGDEHAGQVDPHVWLDPTYVARWAENAALALGRMDPPHQEQFSQNAQRYMTALAQLQDWIETEVSLLPPSRRILTTDHDELGYFARRFGFQIIGTLVASFSSEAEPSARELADLETRLQGIGSGSIFVSSTVNPRLAERVANDTGLQVVPLYTGSLSDPDGPAPDYLALMKYNVRAIITALR